LTSTKSVIQPASPEELAQALADAAAAGRTIELRGANTKSAMAGPIELSDVTLSTTGMAAVLQYEPADLTISVQAGMPWAQLCELLAKNNQMVPLDPPFAASATVGGVVGANSSGPRRRQYGTARDVIIGMKFATLEGKIVSSGGMVVKNVAGLDMAKLMIGSFGTLAAIAVVNFKLAPVPLVNRTFILTYRSLQEAIGARDRILQGVLQPAALDLLNPAAASRVGLEGYCLLLQAGGSEGVMERYSRDLAGADVRDNDAIWLRIREFTPDWLREYPQGAIVRLSATLTGVANALETASGPALARAGNGVVYVYHEEASKANLNGHKGAIEFSPEHAKRSLSLWPQPGTDFSVMQKIKALFDPKNLLNRGRLYGRI
jgi:glycolate oxidase FAD binding subunit